MTVDTAAKESGYAKNTINAWERGYLAPDTVQLIGYLQALGYKLCMVPLAARRPSAAQVDLAAQAQSQAAAE